MPENVILPVFAKVLEARVVDEIRTIVEMVLRVCRCEMGHRAGRMED